MDFHCETECLKAASITRADITDRKMLIQEVCDRKVCQKEKCKETGTVWSDEGEKIKFREKESGVGARKRKPNKTVVSK